MIHFYCPLGHRLIVPDNRAGKKGRCPVCQQRVYVPVADPQPSGRPKARPSAIKVDASSQPVVPPPGAHGPFDDIVIEELGLTDDASGMTHIHNQSPLAPGNRPPPLPPTRYQTVTDEQVSNAAAERVMAGRWFMAIPAGLNVAELRVDPRRMYAALSLAAFMAIAALVAAIPAVLHVHDKPVPVWVPIVLGVSTVHALVALWLASLPDSSTLWIGTVVCVITVAMYAAAMGIVLMTPAGKTMLFDLYNVRHYAGGCCAANVFVQAALAYGLGQASFRWRASV